MNRLQTLRRTMLVFVVLVWVVTWSSARSSLAAGELDVNTLTVNDDLVFDAKSFSRLWFAQISDSTRSFFQRVGDALLMYIQWDSTGKHVKVYKPNVQLTTASFIGKDDKTDLINIVGPFNAVKQGDRLDRFFVYMDVDQLPEKNMKLRLRVLTPSGKLSSGEFIVTREEVTMNDKKGFAVFEITNARFQETGLYRVQVQMKGELTNQQYVSIGEKTIESVKR